MRRESLSEGVSDVERRKRGKTASDCLKRFSKRSALHCSCAACTGCVVCIPRKL